MIKATKKVKTQYFLFGEQVCKTLEREGLEKYLIYVRKELNEFSRELGRTYFSYS